MHVEVPATYVTLRQMEERLISDTLTKDSEFETGLSLFVLQFTGQSKVKERRALSSGAGQNDVLDRPATRPSGLGKTTLAHIPGKRYGCSDKMRFRCCSGQSSRPRGLLTSLESGQMLFIDEIHRLNRVVEEYLYSAMEDFVMNIMIDQGPHAKSIRLTLPKFTLVAATTRSGLLSAPLRSRFGMTARLDYYCAEDLKTIVIRSANILGVEIEEDGALEIARRSRGTPRIANKLLRWVRDFAQVRADNIITHPVADKALTMLDIDKTGLDEMDKRILGAIIHKFSGGPVGLNSIAVAVGEEPDAIEEVYEPYLIQEGYLKRTQQGRMMTDLGYSVAGIEKTDSVNINKKGGLF